MITRTASISLFLGGTILCTNCHGVPSSASTSSPSTASAGQDATASDAAPHTIVPAVPAEGGASSKSKSAADATPHDPEWTQERLDALVATIQGEIESIRGEKFAHPVSAKLATRDSFMKYARETESRESSPEKLAGEEQIAKLLGMIPADMNLFETELKFLQDQVGGYYDPTSKSFYLMDACPAGIASVVLAHELDHALDDQLFDIESRMKKLEGNSDAALAYRSVVEGSGTAVMNKWMFKHMKEIDLGGFEALQQQSERSLSEAPMWMWKPALAVYLCGAAFLAHSDNVMAGQMSPASSADIREAFTHVPRSMEQVLHPDKYWKADLDDEPRKVELDASKLAQGWDVLWQDTLGECALAMVATPESERKPPDFSNPMTIISTPFTSEATRGWGGDRCMLFGKGSGRMLALVTCWDTPHDAGVFYAAMTEREPEMRQELDKLVQTDKFGKDHATSSSVERIGEDAVMIVTSCGIVQNEREAAVKALKFRFDSIQRSKF
jgi:hypothetical protein